MAYASQSSALFVFSPGERKARSHCRGGGAGSFSGLWRRKGRGGGFSSGEGEDLRGAMGPASEDRTLDGVGGDDPAADVACGLGKKTTIQEDQSDQ